MEYTEEKLQEMLKVLENEDTLAALREATEKDEIIRIFAENGVEIDEVAARAACDKINTIRDNGGELSEEDLELVSGGGVHEILGGCGAGGLATYALATAGVAAAPAIGVGIVVGLVVWGGLSIWNSRRKK